MNHIRIGVLTPVWKRHALTRISLEYNRAVLESAGADVYGCVIGSEGAKSARLARGVNYEYVELSNEFLGAKCMAGVSVIREMDVDAVMFIGSDNFLSKKYAKYAVQQIDNQLDALSLKSCYFYEIGSDRLYYGRPFVCTVGSFVSARHLDSIRWKYCEPELTAQLDLSIKRKCFVTAPRWDVIDHCRERFPILDVKSDTNMNSIRQMRKLVRMDFEPAKPNLDRLFPGVRSKLDTLVNKKEK